MKHELTKEQIREIYKNPELLKELFPDAFETVLEAGKWYFISYLSMERLFNFSGDYDINNNPLGYGFNSSNEFIDFDSFGWAYNTIQPATNEQVQEALINEAKKRGYKNGNHICLYNNITNIETDNIYSYNAPYNLLNLGSKCASVVFVDGKWAEIIETELELTLDEIAEKFGVDKVKIKK